jgi:ribosome-binding factor A
MSTERMAKVNHQVQREVSSILHCEMQDNRMHKVTITGAQVSRDLRNARIFYSILTKNDEEMTELIKIFENARGFVQRALGKCLRTKYTPEIHFVYDEAIKEGMRIDALLRKIDKDKL